MVRVSTASKTDTYRRRRVEIEREGRGSFVRVPAFPTSPNVRRAEAPLNDLIEKYHPLHLLIRTNSTSSGAFSFAHRRGLGFVRTGGIMNAKEKGGSIAGMLSMIYSG